MFHLFYSTALTSALNATALIVLASYLQSYHYGMFSVVLALAMIMGYFTDVGLSNIVLREGSKKGAEVDTVISSYIKMRALLLFGTFLFGFIVIEVMHGNHPEMVRTAYFLILPMVTGIAMQSIGTTYFQLIEKMQYCGMIRIVSAICLVSSLTIGMFLSLSPFIITFLYGFSYFVAGVFGVYLVFSNTTIRLKSNFHRGLLQNLGSFTIGGLLFVMLPHLGPIVLEKTLTLKEVGFFAVAYRIPQALQQIPFIVAGAYYPVLFRYFNNRQLTDHFKLMMTELKIMAVIGMAMTIPFFYLSEVVIVLLFGEEWLISSMPLKILSILLTLQAVNITLADGLTTRSLQNYRTYTQLIAAVMGVILYIFLSKEFGIIGAAFAGISIEVIALIGFLLFSPNRWKITGKVLVPYLSFFLLSLLFIDFFLHSIPFVAVFLHMLFLLVLIWADRELREKVQAFVKAKLPFRKWKDEESRRFGNGI